MEWNILIELWYNRIFINVVKTKKINFSVKKMNKMNDAKPTKLAVARQKATEIK